jgi:hypothetical protein
MRAVVHERGPPKRASISGDYLPRLPKRLTRV